LDPGTFYVVFEDGKRTQGNRAVLVSLQKWRETSCWRKVHGAFVPFCAPRVKEREWKKYWTDTNDGEVVVRGQPVVTGMLETPPELIPPHKPVPPS
jgi:hypothetical protein